MPNYTNSTPTYAWGSQYIYWTSPDATGIDMDGDIHAWLRFTGATAVLSATAITSATLTINGIPAPETDESLRVYGEELADAALPSDQSDSESRSLTLEYTTTGSLAGLSSVEIDVKTIIEELVASIGGDVIHLRLTNPSYSGTGFWDVTADLEILYTIGDAVMVRNWYAVLGGRVLQHAHAN